MVDNLKPEHDFSDDERVLYDLMSEISEDCYCAGWMNGNEFALWDAMLTGCLSYGMSEIDRALLARVAALSVKSGRWIIWMDDHDGLDPHDTSEWGPYSISLKDWSERCAARRAAPPVGDDGLPPEDDRPERDWEKWIVGRGRLGPGAVPERIFFAGWVAGRRAAVPAQTGTQPAGDSVDTPEFRLLLAECLTVTEAPFDLRQRIKAELARRAAVSTASAPAEDPVVEANRRMLLYRSRVGISKYGTTLADAGLDRSELVRHALEEALDLANYLQALLREDGL